MKNNLFVVIICLGLGLIFFSCNTKSKVEKVVPTADVAQSLQKYAVETKGVLGKNLMNAINSQGTENAIEFCSTKAIVLTDSMGVVLNASL